MEYRYLKEWLASYDKKLTGRIVSSVRRFRDSIALNFKGSQDYLQIILDSNNPFLFYTSRQLLPFSKDNRIETFNQHLVHATIEDLSISGLDTSLDFPLDIKQPDRLILISMVKRDIYNRPVKYVLINELIPHRENFILTREEGNELVIIDCWSYQTLASRSNRQLLPGTKYVLPPEPISAKDGVDYLAEIHYPIRVQDQLSPKEMGFLSESAGEFFDLNQCFEFLFYEILLPGRQAKLLENRQRTLRKQKEKKLKKLIALKQEYEDSKKADNYKKMAELLKVNLHNVRKGMSELKVEDYYEGEGKEFNIKLKSELSPVQNMNALFRKYRKGVSGKEIIKEQISKTEHEIELIEREIFDLENLPPDAGITEDFFDISQSTRQPKQKREKKERFRRLMINEHWEIFIGRTNRENDELTCRFAKPDDWWFHTRIFHGAHIILRNYSKQEITPELIELCCSLAAYFSKAKNSENVPVDYTQIKYVTKPHGSPPGFVIYKNQKTKFVNPISLREASQLINN